MKSFICFSKFARTKLLAKLAQLAGWPGRGKSGHKKKKEANVIKLKSDGKKS